LCDADRRVATPVSTDDVIVDDTVFFPR